MLRIFVLGLALILGPAAAFGQAPAPPVNSSDQISAKTWLQNRAESEEYLRTAKVIGEEDIPIGVTKPKRMRLEPGGPVEYFAFKAIQPGRYQGFFESYKFEIAAYELDKLLGLDMVPPTVERRIKGVEGAAVMWCSPTKSFKDMGGAPPLTSIPGRHVAQWVRQMARAKLFDNLVGNIDANQGNWLVDPAWNLILIDKTRAFGTD